MITPFIFDKEIFDCCRFKENLLISDALIEDWEKFGILLFSSDDKVKEFHNKIQKDFPVKCKQKWITALSYFPKYITNNSFTSDFSLNKGEEEKLVEISKYAETILLSSENFDLMCENYDLSKFNFSCEILDYQQIKRSRNFENSKKYSIKQIDYREDNQQVFKRLKNIFKYTKELTIVDRYLFKNDFESAYDSSKGTTALKKIFKYLAENKIQINNFSIISSNKDVSGDKVKQLFKDILVSNTSYYDCFSELKVIVRDDRKFSDIFHDRVLRTTYHYLEFGAGIVDALGSTSAERFMTFNCKSRTQVDYKQYFIEISIENLTKNESLIRCSKKNPL